MSDAQNPVLPTNDYNALQQNLPGFPQMVAEKVAQSPRYKALQNPPSDQQASFGAAGLAPLATPAIAAGGLPLAAGAASMLAAPAAAAYGVGKLVAPQWTDETVGKIKDWLQNKVAPTLQNLEAMGSAWETGEAESLPGHQFAEKAMPNVTSYLNVIKSQHPEIAKAGTIGGTIAQFALPGANVIKGAGLLGMAGNAAINAAPYALGHGLDVGATTGNVGQGVKAGLTTEALGTAIPTAVSGIASGIPAVSRFLTKLQLAGAGIRTGDAAKNLRTYAGHVLGLRGPAIDSYVASHAEPLEQKLSGLVDQFGQGRAGKQAMRDWNDAGFDAHNAIYGAVTGNHVTTTIGGTAGMSDADHVLADPNLIEDAAGFFKPQDIQSAVTDMGNNIDGLNWNQARKALKGYMASGNNFNGKLDANDPRILKGLVAQSWHNQIDSIADRSMAWAKEGALGPEAQEASKDVPDLTTLKSTYPAIQSIKKVQGREEPMIPTNFAAGSDTFARLATNAALQGGASTLGGLVGGPAGALVGHVAGPILARAAGKGLERGVGGLAGLLKNAAGAEVPSAALGRATAMGSSLPDMLNGPTNPVGTTMESPAPAPAPIPAQGTPQSPVQGQPPGTQPIPNAAPAQTATPVLSPADQAQQDFVQAGQPPAKPGQWNDAFVNDRMQEKWMRYQRQFGPIPFDQYKAAALRATQNLDPHLPSTWQAMFDDKETGTRLFNSYMNLQKISDVDPGSALNHYTRLFQPGPRLASGEQMKETQDNAKLVQALADMTKQPVKDIDNRLRMIAWNKSMNPEQKKQAVLDMIVKEGGVDVPLLAKMGLW